MIDGQSGTDLLVDAGVGALVGQIGKTGVRALPGVLGKLPGVGKLVSPLAARLPGSIGSVASKLAQVAAAGGLSTVYAYRYDKISEIPPDLTLPAKSQRLRALELALESMQLGLNRSHVRAAIDIALKVPALPGSTTAIDAQAHAFADAASVYELMHSDLEQVAKEKLPHSWRGHAGETAADAVSTFAGAASHAHDAFATANHALRIWSDAMAETQRQDTAGVNGLTDARTQLGNKPDGEVRRRAIDSCRARITATKAYETAATTCASSVGAAARAARARTVKAPGVDPVDAATLAYTGQAGGAPSPADDILTPTALARASQRLSAMSSDDRSAFDELVSNSKSPQEAAYLWEALAAGYSLSDITAFDKQIHEKGGDRYWLWKHLHVNDVANNRTVRDGRQELSYTPDDVAKATTYAQDTGNCTSASTVIARLDADPVLMLGVTTGTGPAAVSGPAAGNDSPKAFRDRLVRVFDDNFDPELTPYPRGDQKMVNNLLNRTTGSTYHMAELSTEEARQAALPRIEAAVAAGKPVPIGLAPKGDGDHHQVVVVSTRPGELQIYNPWGFTQWVTTEQFVKSEMPDIERPNDVMLPD
ncbi:hypothetical protein [Nocardia africana]|uniref:Tox-PL domain-containing protein n=1 Tax=Nocardia africana TaxID=134964 RepID=A0ABW6NLC2_9NOCA